jgi:epoxyqueuosine reductase
MRLDDELRERAGTDIFGVADATSYGVKAPEGHRPADFLKGARSIVLLGIRMLDTSLDGLPGTRQEYTANFHVANAELNRALFDAAGFLERHGYKAFPVPYKEMPGWNLDKRPAALVKALRPIMTAPGVRDLMAARAFENLSYRHMAAAAGLGTIGVNNLLLMPEHGPRVRFVALVTDAALEPGRPLTEEVCKPEQCSCACVRACPAEALNEDGRPTDKAACLKYYVKLGVPGQSGVRCGLCVFPAVCPLSRVSDGV